jgi:hypothetical protein
MMRRNKRKAEKKDTNHPTDDLFIHRNDTKKISSSPFFSLFHLTKEDFKDFHVLFFCMYTILVCHQPSAKNIEIYIINKKKMKRKSWWIKWTMKIRGNKWIYCLLHHTIIQSNEKLKKKKKKNIKLTTIKLKLNANNLILEGEQ